jgi:arginine N-succinyltransferase
MTGFGLTTLPKDRDLLSQRVIDSIRSFGHKPVKPGPELYFFVMEDMNTGRIGGSAAIVSKVGGFEPFYAYRLEKRRHESLSLGIRKEIMTLRLVKEHNGPSEIGALFLAPQFRGKGAGRLLSLSRFLFIWNHPVRFEPNVIAEMRGVVDDQGRSPFWEALGKRFFELDFPQADYLSIKDKRFISELAPEFPIYAPLLPESARQVIGVVHKDTRGALKMLKDEGMRFQGMVDIFEAGPIIGCRTDQIRIARESSKARISDIVTEVSGEFQLLTNLETGNFRACSGKIARFDPGEIGITDEMSRALEKGVGDEVMYSNLKPGPAKREDDHWSGVAPISTEAGW